MRILFTSPILEHPAAGGPQLRIENSIKALSKVCELDIINRDSNSTQETDKFFKNFASEYHVLPKLKPLNTYQKILRLINRLFNSHTDIDESKHAEHIIQHIERREINILWFGYGNISYSLIKKIKTLNPNVKVVCDTDSVWSRYILRELPFAKGLRRFRIEQSGIKKQSEENAWVNLCEVTTAVSEIDAEYYRNIASDRNRIHLFSNVIDTASYLTSPPPPPSFKSPSIYLAGTFGRYNSPMNKAARWMIEEIFPLVLQKHPHVHFYIVGRNSDLAFSDLNTPNITTTGILESVLPYLCNTDVSVVPLQFESGTRFKILEAGACRVPLVSTTLGAEGIPLRNNEHILIADEPHAFADSIIKLLEDKELANKIAKNCHNFVQEHYSLDTLANEAKAILKFLSK